MNRPQLYSSPWPMAGTTVGSWSWLEPKFLLFSYFTGITPHGHPWGVKILSNKGQMLGQNGPNSHKHYQTTIPKHKSRTGV